MFDFTINLAAGRSCLITNEQKSQVTLLVNALNDRRINLRWIPDCETITALHVLRIMSSVHTICRHSLALIHNEIEVDKKRVSTLARVLLKLYPLSLRNQKQIDSDDLLCLKNGNKPDGCSFSSCLGKVVYVKTDGKLSPCPKMSGVHLNSMTAEGRINQIFDTADFKSVLLQQIQKRNRCKSNCTYYNLCLGGCPQQADENQCSFVAQLKDMPSTPNTTKDQVVRHLSNLYRG